MFYLVDGDVSQFCSDLHVCAHNQHLGLHRLCRVFFSIYDLPNIFSMNERIRFVALLGRVRKAAYFQHFITLGKRNRSFLLRIKTFITM